MKTLALSLAAASLLVTTAAAAAPAEVYLGDVASPKRALDGKTFRLKPGQRLRFTNYQAPNAGDRRIRYFTSFSATPARTLYHGAQALSAPRGRDPGGHYRQETFTVLRSAPVGTTISAKGSNSFSADWTLRFKIIVVR